MFSLVTIVLTVLDPLKHKMADLTMDMETLCRSQCNTRLFSMFRLAAIFSDNSLRNLSTSLPRPPR